MLLDDRPAAGDGTAVDPRLGVRVLSVQDDAALAALLTRNDVDDVTRNFHPFELTAQTAHALVTEAGADRYFGGWLGDELVALSMLRGFNDGYEVPSFGVLVDHVRHGQGIGREMTRETLERARRMGCSRVRLGVYRSNVRAHGLYVSLGFVERERTPRGADDERIVMDLELTPARIAVAGPVLDGNELAYVRDCLETEWISSIGGYVERFEREFAAFCDVGHAVSCCNGTAALARRAAGRGRRTRGRGHRPGAHVRRVRQHGRLLRGDARVRRQRPRDVDASSGRRRGCDRSADASDHGRAPVRASRRHGSAARAREAPRPRADRGRRRGPRCSLPWPSGRIARRRRDVQLLRQQDPDHRRGRDGRDRRPAPRRDGAPAARSGPGSGAPLLACRARLQLPNDERRRGDRGGPTRACRRPHLAAPRDRRVVPGSTRRRARRAAVVAGAVGRARALDELCRARGSDGGSARRGDGAPRRGRDREPAVLPGAARPADLRRAAAPGSLPVAERLAASGICLPSSGRLNEADVRRVAAALRRAVADTGAAGR